MFSTITSYSGPQSPFDTHSPASVVSSYSPAGLASAINAHSGSRVLYWRFDLCTTNRTYGGSDGTPQFKSDLTPYVAKFSVQHASQNNISRSLQLDMVETVASNTLTISGGAITGAGVNYLADLVSPVAVLRLGPSEWAHMRLGCFRFTRPGVSVPGYAAVRTATMPDLCSIVQESAAIDPTNVNGVPLTLPVGSNVLDCVRTLITNSPSNVPSGTLASIPGCGLGDWMPAGSFTGALASNTPSDWPTTTAVLGTDYQVAEGTSYLDVINHLLKTICCYPLQSDERGIFRVQKLPTTTYVAFPDVPIPDYTSVTTKWTYDTTADSIIGFGLTEDIRIDDIANIVQVRVEDGVRTPYLATAINTDAGSPYGVNNWGGIPGNQRRIVKVIDDGQIPSIDGITGTNYAQQYAARELLMASWLVDEVQLPIAVNPLHCGYLDHDPIRLNIYQNYVADGSPQNVPVIVQGGFAGLVVTEIFIIDGYTISVTLPTPGSGASLVGNAGVVTDLGPRESKAGSTMTMTAHRTTTTANPANITVQGAT